MDHNSKEHITSQRLRFVTATSLFDGHDASINIIRRLLQLGGAEVIHLGHNRSVKEIVHAAIQEGVQAVAVSSYQGGHIEFFKYIKDLFKEHGVDYIRIFGGGGGVIVPEEIKELENYGITKIYAPEDGQRLGLDGIIKDMLQKSSGIKYPPLEKNWKDKIQSHHNLTISRLISMAEDASDGMENGFAKLKGEVKSLGHEVCTIGITGTGGSGKSSLEDEIIRRFLSLYPDKRIAILAVDPTKKKTGGALLGDRIRMNSIDDHRVFVRSLATRGAKGELPTVTKDTIEILKAARFDLILVETPGIGQGDAGIIDYCDFSIYVMTSEFGAPSQLEKIDMLDYANMIVINKFDHKNSADALRDVRKQYRRNHNIFDVPDEELPVFGTIASNFNDPGLDVFFQRLISELKKRDFIDWEVPRVETSYSANYSKRGSIIPSDRDHYLKEIFDTIRNYHKKTGDSIKKIARYEAVKVVHDELKIDSINNEIIEKTRLDIDPEIQDLLKKWNDIKKAYSDEGIETRAGDKKAVELYSTSLSGLKIPKVILPEYSSTSDLVKWLRKENLPGYFPYTSGVFPFRRVEEDPKRQFAGEGTPEKTNRRFHYLTKNDNAKRLSTAFDSATLYGDDPNESPDIFGKIGESGVSICTLDDMKKLYDGFDLCSPNTSVSMTINGPAPIMLAFFFNTAIDQQIDKFINDNGKEPSADEKDKIKRIVLENVRGTIQADILKEDQGQNSCIFSTGFALKMMGDIQEYFIANKVRNFYSVSISGYHIAEAGANPITQLALTLSNAFTYVEYYLSRGMKIDDFAPNLSFFFSTGMEPEYNVLVRVARRIWAVAMKYKYGANDKSQKLKCHIQTSGRSLHAQEMQFNDIRTTLQALMALNDNCNSLHTNSYDEAVTTPTEESVRRAMAIQLIISKEYGIFKNQNPLQGSFIIEKLTDMVEEAVLKQFEAINERGGVLGAMETYYQRTRIQDESLEYEHRKHTGEYPIIGVNTYLNPNTLSGEYVRQEIDLTRATPEEKMSQIINLREFQKRNADRAEAALKSLKNVAQSGKNIFEELMTTVRYASLGQITGVLYEVGGKYRRSM